MTDKDRTGDPAFDAMLSDTLGEQPVEVSMLTRSVLTRIAQEEGRPGSGFGAEVLARPAPLVSAYALLLLGAAGLGYAALPALGGDEAALLLSLGDWFAMGGL